MTKTKEINIAGSGISKAELITALTNNRARIQETARELQVSNGRLWQAIKEHPDCYEIVKMEMESYSGLVWDTLMEMLQEKVTKVVKVLDLDENGEVQFDVENRPVYRLENQIVYTQTAVQAARILSKSLFPELNPMLKQKETGRARLKQADLRDSLAKWKEENEGLDLEPITIEAESVTDGDGDNDR